MFETQILKVGGVILYPTDTIWGLGCDATNREAIERIIQIKGRSANKNLLILVSDEEMLAEYVENIPSCARDLLHSVQTPATIIYPQAKNLPIDLLSNNTHTEARLLSETAQRVWQTHCEHIGKPERNALTRELFASSSRHIAGGRLCGRARQRRQRATLSLLNLHCRKRQFSSADKITRRENLRLF